MKMGEKPVTFGGQSGFAWPVSRLARPVQLRGLRNAMKIRSPLTVQDHEPVHREGQSRKSIVESFASRVREFIVDRQQSTVLDEMEQLQVLSSELQAE
ncbi:hypothetical protein RJ60_13610 [Mesotoga sp. B105.6.4]|nr:hypothetical protein RJ60_13610 [Mesotoga sp. B105.6.4]